MEISWRVLRGVLWSTLYIFGSYVFIGEVQPFAIGWIWGMGFNMTLDEWE